MTEKRFEVKHDIPIGSNHYGIIDNITGEKYDKTKYDSQKLCNIINSFIEENEQLKQTMKEVCELLEEEVDLFSDKATEHDINAYMELRELDNKDAYYMATATKKAIKLLKGDVE